MAQKLEEAVVAKGQRLTSDEIAEIRLTHMREVPDCPICPFITKAVEEAHQQVAEMEERRDRLTVLAKVLIAKSLDMDTQAETERDAHNPAGSAMEPIRLPNGWSVVVQYTDDADGPHLIIRDSDALAAKTVYVLVTGDEEGMSACYWRADWERWASYPVHVRDEHGVSKMVPHDHMVQTSVRDVLNW
jgi:hypothetical protein